jgi:Type III secretion protein YscO
MKSPLFTLLRVKQLKEEQALKDAKAKREAAARAAEATEAARKKARASAATLEERQDAVYRNIIGRVIKLDDIEDTKGRVVQIEKEHGKLVDAETRCAHVQAEAETARDTAAQRHRQSVKDVDKYVLLADGERAEALASEENREEIEIEDLFGTNRRGRL